MPQLIMRWKNDGNPSKLPDMPDCCSLVNIKKLDNGIEVWLDIVSNGLSNGRETQEYYTKLMVNWPHYNPEFCFFIIENENPVATLTVIPNYETKEGYIHMVACKEECRGKGYGSLLNKIAIHTLKEQGMETAYLTTDDWRIPAIKSYLRIGFEPDVSNDDFKTRWRKIFTDLNLK